jgi:alpha-ketoglutarate-dependent taurine dioxygenase
MELVPLADGFGVEVKGVSLLDVATDADAYKGVREAFETHSLLVFRDQQIADDIQVAYSRAFGPLELTKAASLGENSFYSRLTNVGQQGEIVPPDHRQVLVAKANALWHTDSSFKKTPALASVLTARVLPGRGRRDRIHFDAARLGAAAGGHAGEAERGGGDSFLCQQPRPDPSRPRECRRSARRCRRCAGS